MIRHIDRRVGGLGRDGRDDKQHGKGDDNDKGDDADDFQDSGHGALLVGTVGKRQGITWRIGSVGDRPERDLDA